MLYINSSQIVSIDVMSPRIRGKGSLTHYSIVPTPSLDAFRMGCAKVDIMKRPQNFSTGLGMRWLAVYGGIASYTGGRVRSTPLLYIVPNCLMSTSHLVTRL